MTQLRILSRSMLNCLREIVLSQFSFLFHLHLISLTNFCRDEIFTEQKFHFFHKIWVIKFPKIMSKSISIDDKLRTRNDSIVLFPKIDARRRLCLVRSPLCSTSETKKLDSLLTVASRFSDIHIHRSGSRDPSVAQTVSIWTHYLAFGVLLFFLSIDSLQFSNIIRPNSSYIVNHFNFNCVFMLHSFFVISKSYNSMLRITL